MAGRLARGSLNQEVIIDAALRALAQPGAQPVTMRTLAGELGADPTAVYRHFRNKNELLRALTDRLLDDLTLPQDATSWREYLRQVAVALHALLARAPGAVSILAESPFTAASLRMLDDTVAELIERGLMAELAAEACQTVVLYVIGHASAAAGDPAGFWNGMLDETADTPLPALQQTAKTWQAPARHQFDTGLELLLDGVATRTP